MTVTGLEAVMEWLWFTYWKHCWHTVLRGLPVNPQIPQEEV